MEYLPPTSDSVFKALFGDQKNKEFILSFLRSFLECPNDEFLNVKFLDPLFPIEYKNGKYCTLDLLIETKNGHKINIEMQNEDLDGFGKRVSYYLSRMTARQLNKSEDYDLLNRSIIVFILNYEMKPEKFNNSFAYFKECLSNWRMRNKKGEDLTDSLEVNIIELPKVPKEYKNNLFYDWLNFIKAKKKEDFEMIEKKTQCKELKDAVVTLRKLSGDELQQAIYEAELDAKRVQNAAIKTAKREGKEEGLAEGLAAGEAKGKAEGETNAKIEAVCKLVTKYKADIDEAMKDLGLDSKYKTQVLDKLKGLDG